MNSDVKLKTTRFFGMLLFIPAVICLSIVILSVALYVLSNSLGHLNNYVTNSQNVIDWSVPACALVGAGFLTVVGIILLIPGWILKHYGYSQQTTQEKQWEYDRKHPRSGGGPWREYHDDRACDSCGEYPCECPCPECGHYPCDCYYE